MSDAYAEELARNKIAELRSQDYGRLLQFLVPNHALAAGPDGEEYWVEIQAFWDDPRQRANLRLMVSVGEKRGRRRWHPLTADFIMAPDGSFVGE